MEDVLKSIFAALILTSLLVNKGMCQCSLSDIKVTQNLTEAEVQGKPEYEVTVSNNCICTQQNVVLDCAGFNTVEVVDPKVLEVNGDSCSLSQPLYGYSPPVKFKYAWDISFSFTPTGSLVSCS